MKITAIKEQQKNRDKVNIFVDGEYGFSLTKNELLNQNLYLGKELLGEEIENLRSISSYQKVFAKSLDYVSRRAHSELELRQKLKRKDFDPVDIDRAIASLKEYEYLNDANFSRSYIEDKKRINLKSKRHIELELKKKGVSKKSLEILDENYTKEEELLNIQKILEKKYAKKFEKVKAVRFLLGRGFPYDLIKKSIDDL